MNNHKEEIKMKYTYKELLIALNDMFYDYGREGVEYPDYINEQEEIASLTEEQCHDIFDYNDGDIDGITCYIEDDEEE